MRDKFLAETLTTQWNGALQGLENRSIVSVSTLQELVFLEAYLCPAVAAIIGFSVSAGQPLTAFIGRGRLTV